jgi:hypothetical protein
MSEENKFRAGSFFLLFSTLAIIACVGFLYKIHKGIILNPRCIEVSAEAEKIISADRATWNISFDKTGVNQAELNKLLLTDRDKVQKFFEDNGIEKEDMEFSFFIHEDYRETKKTNKTVYRAGYNLVIKSKDIEKILSLRDQLSGLYGKGIVLSNNHIDFKCSTNDEVQNELISEAAVKAYAKAKRLAKDLHIGIRRIHKIYDPNCYIEGMNRVYMMKSVAAMNSVDGVSGGQENSQPIPKRKMKVTLRMDVEIK